MDDKDLAAKLADLKFMIQLAHEAGRPFDMIPLVKQFVPLTPHLNFEERVLYSLAYHESVVSLRESLEIIQPLLAQAQDGPRKTVIQGVFDKMCGELHQLCSEVIETTDSILLPVAESAIDLIFYNKMKGDYWRYDAEFQSEKLRTHAIEEAEKCYEVALKHAEENLAVNHPMRLGLILNYTVLLADACGEREKGRAVAMAAIEAAEKAFGEDDKESHDKRDAEICLKLLKDNCELWKQEEAEK